MLYSQREAGQGLLEYGLILTLVAVVVVIVLIVLGGSVENLYQHTINILVEVFS
jgi:Flp pilus assembly pilin Flp